MPRFPGNPDSGSGRRQLKYFYFSDYYIASIRSAFEPGYFTVNAIINYLLTFLLRQIWLIDWQ